MKLLLRKDIDKLGFCGDVVEVSSGYARNCLLPQGLAMQPTKVNVKSIEVERKRAAAERERRRAALERLVERLTGAEVTISAACTPEGHLYGSVGPREISRALIEEGFSVHPDHVKMSTNVKQIGTQEVTVELADDLKATVKVWVVAEKAAGLLEQPEPGAPPASPEAGTAEPAQQ